MPRTEDTDRNIQVTVIIMLASRPQVRLEYQLPVELVLNKRFHGSNPAFPPMTKRIFTPLVHFGATIPAPSRGRDSTGCGRICCSNSFLSFATHKLSLLLVLLPVPNIGPLPPIETVARDADGHGGACCPGKISQEDQMNVRSSPVSGHGSAA